MVLLTHVPSPRDLLAELGAAAFTPRELRAHSPDRTPEVRHDKSRFWNYFRIALGERSSLETVDILLMALRWWRWHLQ